MRIRLVTDSAADLPEEYFGKGDITVIEMPVFAENGEELRGEALSPHCFYERMRRGERFSVGAVSTERYLGFFEESAKRGERVLYGCVSSELSENFRNAERAYQMLLSRYPEFCLEVINTREASLGLGIPLLHAYEALSAEDDPWGRSRSRLVYESMHQKLIFTVSDVDYLFPERCRVRTEQEAARLAVPVLEISTAGKFSIVKRTHGSKKAVDLLLELAGQYGTSLSGKPAGIVHGDNPALAASVAEALRTRYGVTETITVCMNAAVGAKLGPDAIGIVFAY